MWNLRLLELRRGSSASVLVIYRFAWTRPLAWRYKVTMSRISQGFWRTKRACKLVKQGTKSRKAVEILREQGFITAWASVSLVRLCLRHWDCFLLAFWLMPLCLWYSQPIFFSTHAEETAREARWDWEGGGGGGEYFGISLQWSRFLNPLHLPSKVFRFALVSSSFTILSAGWTIKYKRTKAILRRRSLDTSRNLQIQFDDFESCVLNEKLS